jgi:hypothetical protein
MKSGRWSALMKAPPAHRRGARTGPGQARAIGTLRLRVSAQRHGQSLRLPRARPGFSRLSGSGHRIGRACDNLSTHSPSALYQTFPPSEARRILRRIEFHYTPRHASWLNMVEIEIGVLRTQCLDRRIDNRELLISEVAARERQRNKSRALIKWMFTPKKPAPKWPAPTQSQSTSHNPCEEVLS